MPSQTAEVQEGILSPSPVNRKAVWVRLTPGPYGSSMHVPDSTRESSHLRALGHPREEVVALRVVNASTHHPIAVPY